MLLGLVQFLVWHIVLWVPPKVDPWAQAGISPSTVRFGPKTIKGKINGYDHLKQCIGQSLCVYQLTLKCLCCACDPITSQLFSALFFIFVRTVSFAPSIRLDTTYFQGLSPFRASRSVEFSLLCLVWKCGLLFRPSACWLLTCFCFTSSPFSYLSLLWCAAVRDNLLIQDKLIMSHPSQKTCGLCRDKVGLMREDLNWTWTALVSVLWY